MNLKFNKFLFFAFFYHQLNFNQETLNGIYDIKKTLFENITSNNYSNYKIPKFQRPDKSLWVDFLGYKIASPIGIPACPIMTGAGIELASKLGFDILTYKTIRIKPNGGNPLPNIVFLKSNKQISFENVNQEIYSVEQFSDNKEKICIANSFGNPSFDLEFHKRDIKRAKDSLQEGQILIVSVFGETKEEFVKTALFAVECGADIIEANFSCPNIINQNHVIYTNPDLVYDISKSIIEAIKNKPLIIKIGIFENENLMREVLIKANQAGVKGICAINSVPMKILKIDNNLAFDKKRIMCGVSGNLIRNLAIDFIKKAKKIIDQEKLNLKIIATGGITMAKHFKKFLKLGATIAMSATGMMWNPNLAAEFHNQMQKENIAVKLYEIGAVKFGDFTFKSGIKSPIYIDLRTSISYPQVLEELSCYICNEIVKNKTDLVCGVPYAAVPIATIVSLKSNIPLIMPRKEIKSHGTKKNIEGDFKAGQNCLIIEDVITSGGSILEIIETLKKQNITPCQIITIMDWQQKGKENLAKQGYVVNSIFTVSEFFNILYKHKKIDLNILNKVNSFLTRNSIKEENIADKYLTYSQRSAMCKNSVGKKLLELMDQKQTNLAIALDVKKKKDLLQMADDLGPEICLLKTHIDIIEDFDEDLINKLCQLSKKHNFLILEDRKFSDIGAITSNQYVGGIYKINQWADTITVHSIAGQGILDSLKNKNIKSEREIACFLIAQMSSHENLISDDYSKATLDLAIKNRENVIGLICQKKISQDASIIHVTPGVQLLNSKDNLGQQYITPQTAIENGSDIIIVGRGILQSNNPKETAKFYRKLAWDEYQKRILKNNFL